MSIKWILGLSILAACGAAPALTAAANQAVVTGRVVSTKALTKKGVTIPSYQLSGVSVDPQLSAGFFRRRVTANSGEVLAVDYTILLNELDPSEAPAGSE